MPDTDTSFLGKGMKFPPQINPATGRFVVSGEAQSVRESIYLILMTQVTERPLRPDFGSNIMSYTFMDQNASRLNMVTRTIKDQILNQEPRVSDVRITLDSGSQRGVLLFNIDYYLQGINTRDNLVFPFYLNAAAESQEEGEPESYEPEAVEEIGN
ncbi:MAG: GPW/gp25 family protein [Lachnospiraceae bacterium]|nr:GPW/gp25 family protein [Lachnospiraceae bacterium]